MNRWLAELIGTFTLVWVGTGAIVVNDVYNGSITHLGIALAFGLVVTVMIFAFIGVSGAHLNPAVTLGLALSKQIPISQVPGYVMAQSAGAILASLSLSLSFPEHEGLGATQLSVGWSSGLLIEAGMSFMLLLVILAVATGPEAKTAHIALAVGGIVGLEALVGGPLTGASMNPARSLGPALISGNWTHFWLYCIGPIGGMALAALCCPLFRFSPNCCEKGC